MRRLLATVVMAAGLVTSSAVIAGPVFDFDRITTNGGSPNADAQLTVEVAAVAGQPSQVDFILRNSGPNPSIITAVYFDDGTLLGIASIINGAGVSFSQGASPGDLPAGNTINFATTTGFLADADPPPGTNGNGVDPGEQVTIRFNLLAGQDIDDTIAAMLLSLASPGVDVVGGLRIGIHVQGYGNGQSESFVNGGCVRDCPPPGQQIPEPATLALLGLALAGMGIVRRRRSVS